MSRKTPVTILPASRNISAKSGRSLYFMLAHKEENFSFNFYFISIRKSIFHLFLSNFINYRYKNSILVFEFFLLYLEISITTTTLKLYIILLSLIKIKNKI